jgi:hypothetical protein
MMHRLSSRCRSLWLIRGASLACLLAAGCSDRLPTYPVSGRVIFPDGSPVHTGTIELQSLEHPVQARGTIGMDGMFSLTTYEKNDGAVAGKHSCVVVQLVLAEEVRGFHGGVEGVVHPRFGSYASSGLQFEIDPDRDNFLTVRVVGMPEPMGGKGATRGHSHVHEHPHQQAPNSAQR